MQIFYPTDAAFERKRARLYRCGGGRARSGIDPDRKLGLDRQGRPDAWRQEAERWQDLGVQCLTVNTEFHHGHHVRADLKTLDDHLEVLELYRDPVAELI